MAPAGGKGKGSGRANARTTIELRLHVAGEAPNSVAAHANLMQVLSTYPGSNCKIDVIDCMTDPEMAVEDGVLVTPMLIRVSPEPRVRIVGDLSNHETVARTLGFEE